MNLNVLLGLFVAYRSSRGMSGGRILLSILLALVGMIVVGAVLS